MASRLSQFTIETATDAAPTGRLSQFALETLGGQTVQEARLSQFTLETVGGQVDQRARLSQFCIEYLWGPAPIGTVVPPDGTTNDHLTPTHVCCSKMWAADEGAPCTEWTVESADGANVWRRKKC